MQSVMYRGRRLELERAQGCLYITYYYVLYLTLLELVEYP